MINLSLGTRRSKSCHPATQCAELIDMGFPHTPMPVAFHCCNMVCRQKYNIPPYTYSKSNRQVALVLLHSDWATTNAEPLAPHIVSVGALTAAPAKALPSDLEEFMQSAGEHGVVYASLGTTAIPGASFCSDLCAHVLVGLNQCLHGPSCALKSRLSPG